MSGPPEQPPLPPIPSDLLFLNPSVADAPRSTSPVVPDVGSSPVKATSAPPQLSPDQNLLGSLARSPLSPSVLLIDQNPAPDALSPQAPSQAMAAVGGFSDEKAAPAPDPRWPYLNRWSGGNSLAASIGQTETSATIPRALSTRQITDPVETPTVVLDPSPVHSLEAPAAVHDSSVAPAAVQESPSVAPAKAILLKGTAAPPPQPMDPQLNPPSPPTLAGPDQEHDKAPNGDRQPSVNRNASQQPSLKGAWTKKLKFLPIKATDHSQPTRSQPVVSTPGAAEDDARFPWAAKMNPSSRNLYRAVEPEYLEDGTPKVTIPPHVLLQGLENQKEYVLGQFFRCSPPPGGLIYAIFNKVWGRNCKITIQKLSTSSYLFHIPEEATRNWVLQRGLWHVDDCLMFVAPWTPKASLAIPEIKTIPVWVTLKNIPSILYSIRGISHIASGLGAPMATHKPRLDPIFMGEAKILVEVELSKAFPPRVAADDKNGCIWMVDVEYAWLPSTCNRCGQLGHKAKRCLQPVSESLLAVEPTETLDATTTLATKTTQLVATTTNTSSPTDELPPTDPVCKEILTPTLIQTSQESEIPSLSAPSGHFSYSTAVSQEGHVVSTKAALVSSVSKETPAIISHPIEIIPHFESVSNESPRMEIAPPALSNVSPGTLASSHREGKQHVTSLGTNQFASLASSGGDEIHSDSDIEPESMDLMTPPGKRILRDRPVKQTAKAIENSWQVKGRGKGGRGRGGRG